MVKSLMYRYAKLRFYLAGLHRIVQRDADSKWSGHWKLWKLYSWVRRNKPDRVLEYGSGYSTLIIAEALRRNRRGILWSVDHKREWSRKAASRLSKQQAARTQMIVAPIVSLKDFHHYGYKPPIVVYDLIYIDGPDYIVGFEDGPVSGDVIHFDLRVAPTGCIMIDNRKATVAFMERCDPFADFTTDIFGQTTIT